MKKRSRRTVVFASLIGTLTLTSGLLLLLAPTPLTPNATSLMAVDGQAGLDAIFKTRVPQSPGQWRYIYIRQSKTSAGNADTLAEQQGYLGDHFIIGNGEGARDGEILVSSLWSRQLPATPPPRTRLDPAAISICLVGDLDRTVPTATQVTRLAQLVQAFQTRYGIDASGVLFVNDGGTPATVGRYFPATAFRERIAR